MCFKTKSTETKTVSFKKGDLVTVLRKPTPADKSDWSNSWNVKMGSAVGQTGTVVKDYEDAGVLVHVSSIKDWDFYYPKSILKHVVASAPATTELVATTDSKLLIANSELAAKFKPGNKVRAHFPDYHSKREGWIGTVVPIEVSGYVRVRFEKDNEERNLYPQRLTLIEAQAEITGYDTEPGIEPAKPIKTTATRARSQSQVFIEALNIALQLGHQQTTVNADQVQDKLAQLGYKSSDLGNAAGALFRGKNWKKVGTIKSTRAGNHSREITNWRYVGA